MAVVIAYTGYSGSGKTYHMTQTALKLIAMGIDVYSRHEIKGARPLLDDREMIYLENCHCFLDEWHQDHDASEWRKLSPLVKHIVTQARKYNITLHWSAQDWRYMDSYIRRNTEDCWLHEAMFPDPLTGRSKIGVHRAWKVHGLDMELQRRRPDILAKKRFRIKRSVYESYDSYKKILLSSTAVSDEELSQIRDPSEREIIDELSHARRGSYRELDLRIEPDDNLPPDHPIDENPDAVCDEGDLDSEPCGDNQQELVDRDNETYKLCAGVKKSNPFTRFFRKGRDRGQEGTEQNDQVAPEQEPK